MTPHEMLAQATAPESRALPMPKALLVFAHQDDEIIGLGARLARFTSAHMVHVTDGAPRNEHDSRAHGFPSYAEYRAARAVELDNALHLAGLANISRECLDIPDQQAALNLADLTRTILHRLEQHQTAVIFTHPYEGGHPDHDACAFAVHAACRLSHERGSANALILECPSYHLGPDGIQTGIFLPDPPSPPPSHHEIVYQLTPEEQSRKRALVECFSTQRDTLSYFSFDEERLRIAPRYDFTQSPHPAPVWYDRFPWGMTSHRFCRLAEEALRTLHAHQETTCR